MSDLSQRCGPPGDDDFPIQSLQVAFGTPVFISPTDQRDLHRLFTRIIDRPANQPREGVHWLSGLGAKPSYSKADATLLGVATNPDAPEVGEPTFDDSVFYFESTARGFVSDKERERETKSRIGGGRKDKTLTADEESDCKELSRDLFGEGEEPLTPGQYLAVKCIVDERDNILARLASIEAAAAPFVAWLKMAEGTYACTFGDAVQMLSAKYVSLPTFGDLRRLATSVRGTI